MLPQARCWRIPIAPANGQQIVQHNFEVTDVMLADFHEMLKGERLRIDEDAFTKDRDFIKTMIRYRIDEDSRTVVVVHVGPRSDAYRPQ